MEPEDISECLSLAMVESADANIYLQSRSFEALLTLSTIVIDRTAYVMKLLQGNECNHVFHVPEKSGKSTLLETVKALCEMRTDPATGKHLPVSG